MRLSINLTEYSWPDSPLAIPDHLDAVFRAADEGGLDTVWIADHLMQLAPGTAPEQEMLEAYATLGYLAARTTRVRLGTMVTAATYRPPALLIKAVTTIDVLSRGRAWLGIGAGYQQEEADAMDLPLPPTRERFEHLEDTLRLALQMWSEDDSAFTGARHHLGRPINSPNAVTRPHPPILVGGTGEKRTLRLVAQYADACNLFDVPDGGAMIRHKLGVLAEHCADLGRPFGEIEKTVSTRYTADESPAAFAERCAALADLGIDHVVAITSGPWTADVVHRLSGAVPTLHAVS